MEEEVDSRLCVCVRARHRGACLQRRADKERLSEWKGTLLASLLRQSSAHPEDTCGLQERRAGSLLQRRYLVPPSRPGLSSHTLSELGTLEEFPKRNGDDRRPLLK
uniref:Uncharacterized protein n=1 Tax=Knipowitschia caucasica TaxID=637954 RepID=A0AAV2JZG1_KNICA